MEDSIVIVGRGLAVPGARDAATFWANIAARRSEFRPPPPGRWSFTPATCEAPAGAPAGPDRVTSAIGCFVDEVCVPAGGGVPGEIVRALDPMFHLLLHAGRDAWGEARTECVDPRRSAVVCGNILLPTTACARLTAALLGDRAVPVAAIDPPTALNTEVGGLPALVLAQDLGLGGGAYTLDAACASSLFALEHACDALRARRVDAVLAGGLSRADALYTQMGFSALGALSRRGRCTPFDASADGLVVGEGAAMFVLKRAADAEAAGDRIYATVAGIGLSNDIGGSLMAPDREGQLRALRGAYVQAGWEPHRVGLIECHGTGTPLGDATEIQSLRALWTDAPAGARAAIGSVKGNVGHLLTGAGAVGLFKALLALEHRTLPPTAGFTAPPDGADLGPFEVLRSAREWPAPARGGRRAGVSAFGFGGTNAHVLLEGPGDTAGTALLPRPRARARLAIVGIGAHIGPWSSRDEVLARLREAPPAAGPVPPTNWFGHPTAPRHPGYYVGEFEIAAARLRVPPKELEDSLPQQLLALAVAREAVDDAALAVAAPDPRIGVFIGTGLDLNTTSFTARWAALAARRPPGPVPSLDANRTMGALGSISASRIARSLRAGGPAFTVSGQECSGLVALDLAARALDEGTIDVAVVGAVDLAGDPRAVLARAARGGDAPRAPSGEGALAIVLMRAPDAAHAGKPAYGHIGSIRQRCRALRLPAEDGPGSEPEDRTAARVGHTGAAHGLTVLIDAVQTLGTPAGPGSAQRVRVSSPLGAEISVALAGEPIPRPRPLRARPAEQGPRLRFANRSALPLAAATPAVTPAVTPIATPTAGARTEPSAALGEAAIAVGAAHARFLEVTAALQQTVARLGLAPAVVTGGPEAATPTAPTPTASDPAVPRSLSREACLRFARGRAEEALGPCFRDVDALPSRVRLPDEPLMLVDRILDVEGEPRSLSPGRVLTEHDVRAGAWYLDAGHAPTCIVVEAGQADLFLCGFLGIDAATGGNAVYRLLDAAVTFSGELPRAGATLRYDIRITRFFRLGATHLFRFEFDATADGHPLMRMRDGCAGFFTPGELAAGRGLPGGPMPVANPGPGSGPTWDLAPRPASRECLDETALERLREGDLAAAFGPGSGHLDRARHVPLPGGRMRLVHRITRLEADGGRYRRGLVVGEADIAGDEWFLTCHFVGDEVMPGTLMYECCLHTLRVFLLRYGWTSGEASDDGDRAPLRFEPIPGITSRLRCRGQVTAATRVVRYEIHVKSLEYGDGEVPQAMADAVMYADHRPIVHMENLCLRLRGASRTGLERAWSGRRAAARRPGGEGRPREPLFAHDRVLEFASGRPSHAFGAGYREFDHRRKLARLPRPPFNFLHRVIDVAGCEPWVLAPGARARAEFDTHRGDWFFAEYRDRRLPYAVLLETGLQACGWLAAYLGSALAEHVDLAFRNLDGRARIHAPVAEPEADTTVTLETELELVDVSRAPQMIIQRYRFRVRAGERDALSVQTTFGFFSADALARQPGIAGAGRGPLAHGTGGDLTAAERERLLQRALPRGRLRMLETLDIYLPHAGPSGLGYLRASARVDPGRWYFEAHFYQDPVCPGSLGLEAFVQLLRVAASHRWAHLDPGLGWTVAPGSEHEWKYRGQILPSSRSYTVEAVVDAVDDSRHALTASGLLHVDGCVIYRMDRFTIVAGEIAAVASG